MGKQQRVYVHSFNFTVRRYFPNGYMYKGTGVGNMVGE